MAIRLSAVTVMVPDYDQALDYYVNRLGFHLFEDTVLSPEKRWVVIGADPGSETKIVLAKAADARQTSAIGMQAGGRVFLFLETDDFDAEHVRLAGQGVKFLEGPRTEPYGTVAVFEDRFGNRWDLIQPAAADQ